MCGIYLTNIAYKKEEIVHKLQSIEFRGPNNLGYQKINDVSFGHLRLSIVDLEERSNQPYHFNKFTIVFNGEIYNYKEIQQELIAKGYEFETTSDTEVLIKGYSEWGEDILKRLNGMFAFAIYNRDENTLFCAKDRLGVKPFYYYWKDGLLEISSQMRPLINQASKLSNEAISIYLDCGYVPSPFSILENVYKLPAGNFMKIDLNTKSLITKQYWNLSETKVKDISYETAQEELHTILKDAVKIRMYADVPFGSFLSGGIDSALVTSIASSISPEPIRTFSIGFEDPAYDESKIAAQYASILGTSHTESICTSQQVLNMLPDLIKVYDEPFADSSALPSLLLNSVTKQYVTVALSGDGGDESFLGYRHFGTIAKFNKIRKVPYFIRKILSHIPLYSVLGERSLALKGLLSSKDSDDLAFRVFSGFETLQKRKIKKWKDFYIGYKKWSTDPIQRAADLNIKLWLENDSNVKVDRASMAYSVEVRSPFLDYRIIEYGRSLPVSFRFQEGKQKKILRDILKNYIPEEVFNQPKKGFAIPLKDWIRKDLKNEILQELNDDFLNKVPNLNIKKFKKQLKDHIDGKRDYAFNIWKLFILAKWHKEFGLSF